jgi:beta-galactosidase
LGTHRQYRRIPSGLSSISGDAFGEDGRAPAAVCAERRDPDQRRPKQPNATLADVFGASEADIDFTPDLLENLKFRMGDRSIGGRYFKQVYTPTTGKAIGWYADGSVAAVEHRFGKGNAILIGTFPGAAYFKKPNAEAREVFRSLLPHKQRVSVTNPLVIARLHEGAGGTTLWVINPTRELQTVSVTVDGAKWREARDVWSNAEPRVHGDTIDITIGDRDAGILELEAMK